MQCVALINSSSKPTNCSHSKIKLSVLHTFPRYNNIKTRDNKDVEYYFEYHINL